MSFLLARPSFWTEPRDPWAWQRALRALPASGIPDPWPCWEQHLRGLLPRRAIPGLYGLRPPLVLGAGLLIHDGRGWFPFPRVLPLVDASREEFQILLATWLVERSPWLRLALLRLADGRWCLPAGVAPLGAARGLRVGHDLLVEPGGMKDTLPGRVTGELNLPARLPEALAPRDLAPLQAPLYLLHALGWLDDRGRPRLPDPLAATLLPPTPAAALRHICAEEADPSGFVPVDTVARRLWSDLHDRDSAPRALAAWTDTVFGDAIDRGSIEVHAWAPGQPRHGRGLRGDRDRKLARWTVHDDFTLPSALIRTNDEGTP